MKKKIVILGAGMVVGPLVTYLAEKNYDLIVADIDKNKADKQASRFKNVMARQVDSQDESIIVELIKWCDLAVSLLPAPMHPKIARKCIYYKKNMVTASYVDLKMSALDGDAKNAGVVLLNEIGVDPGIDHMSAKKIFDKVKDKGGKVLQFLSYCGGLPAHDANTNPLGYKFSWSPMGVLQAAVSGAEYLMDGRTIIVKGEDLFTHYWLVDTGKAGVFEAYPNRNSLEYIDLFNLKDVLTICRGTLRNISHCDTWYALVKLGFFDNKRFIENIDCSIREFLAKYLLKTKKDDDIEPLLIKRLNLEKSSVILKKFEWLGLFEDQKLNLKSGTPMDVLAHLMLDRMSYQRDERDMLVMHHDIIADFKGNKQQITSTMFETGDKGGESAMAKTVGLPAAIGAKMILDGEISLKGVLRPLSKDIYEPVLKELENKGITMVEKYGKLGDLI